ncbi:hypothetical protein ASPZODRAFT_1804322 [Penicilliopsis zonata CBS 506.65]|uniref:Uncharacterized protein n=1 Tax=Penicilliopsis zonata CBS 506.65 TaxID=1073090 RepID=A0A1L9SL96_9EURO|nr:hypothetical protein ASPZODRAFT_1804322 [Penicilliopsis zonata CBS 506.65]OJJ47893.1 hypothetical protein ASPZODRAFT_1804322 [Penicilliopsis zonata CBS 506.65]
MGSSSASPVGVLRSRTQYSCKVRRQFPGAICLLSALRLLLIGLTSSLGFWRLRMSCHTSHATVD